MLDMQAVQREVSEWCGYNFKSDGPEAVVLGTVEEIGELVEAAMLLSITAGRLSRAVLKRSQGIRGSHEEWTAALQKETADVLIKLFHIATIEGFDLEAALHQRWGEVKKRDFVKNPTGHGMPDDPPVITGEVGKAIDEFLANPGTGVVMRRPERERRDRPTVGQADRGPTDLPDTAGTGDDSRPSLDA